MSLKLECTLYYANWCSHCVDFKTEWNKLKENIANINNEYNGVQIIMTEYEDKKLKSIGGGKINGKDIEGYPTFKFGLTYGKAHKEYEYLKQRDSKIIFNYIQKICTKLALLANKKNTK